uniref:Putative methyltransferase n=1 Tax=viral metagenome TaxID=1070528 RepID=A0A6M3JFA6_9ZZZZ
MIILKEVPTASIIVGTRFREVYDDIDVLIESMKKEGVIQPLAVCDNEDGTYTLLAGGRRITAALKANIESLPVRCYPSTLNDLERRSIELMENVCRKDLDWLEAAKLKKEIHLLQTQIYGEKTSTNADASGVSKRDTASLLGISHASLIQDMQLADAVKLFPELAKAKNKSDATKMLGKLQEEMVRSELAARIEAKTSTTPLDKLHQNLINQYLVNDFFEGVKQVPTGSIDFIELDPPYAIDLNSQKRDMKLGYTDNYNEVDVTTYDQFLINTLTECKRVMTSASWMVIWHAKQWRWTIQSILASLELEFDEGLWYKGPVGQTNTPALHLASSFEPFMYVRKGSPSIIRQGRSNVFHYKPVFGGNKIHPTERPIEMIQDMIQTFCWEGARILVPFLGSGNTILAASNLGMIAFGFDLGQTYKDAFTVRVAEGRPGAYRLYKEVTDVPF